MIDNKYIIGGKSQAKKIIVGKDTIYVHSDIQPLSNSDNLYKYHEIQYTKDEYLNIVIEQNEYLKQIICTMLGIDDFKGNKHESVALATNKLFNKILQQITVENPLDFIDMYELWETNKNYTSGNIVKYIVNGDTKLYKVISNHKSKKKLTPDVSTDLYELI